MKQDTIKIGFAPTKRDIFNHPEAFEMRKQILEKIKTFGFEIVDIDDVTARGMLETDSDVAGVVKKFHDEGVAGVFVPHCNFGSEGTVTKVAMKLKLPMLIWGPRDPDPELYAENGQPVVRPRDTQCGLFGTGKALRRGNIPFTYLPNTAIDSPVFERGYKAFAAVCAVVKAAKETRVLQIGVRPDAFWTVICNEGELLERFGVQVFPVNLSDLKVEAEDLKKNSPDLINKSKELIRSEVDVSDVTDADLTQLAAYLEAVKSLCEKNGCNAVATTCWASFRREMGISCCGINGFLTEMGIPVACEADIHGALTSRMVQAANLYKESTFFADITMRHPTNDNAELLWHCGNFPPSLAAKDAKPAIKNAVAHNIPCPGKNAFELKHGDITVCRFDGDHGEYSMFIGEGKGVSGPITNHTYSWIEVNDWEKWEHKLVTGPYIHHSSCVFAKVAPIMHEACKYLGIKADPIDPTEEEIFNFWLGR